ncbi:MAG: YhdH/YhfP family quinone oxidoreductase, partial [Bacteroidales bacterium]
MFKAYRTHEVDGKFKSEIVLLDDEKLSEGEVIIKVAFSGINYKDYLSSQGNKGVTKQYPHTPGIDAAGVVVKDRTQTFQPGEEVVVMGYDLGMNTDGGFAEYIAVPAAWVLRKPGRFTLKETMQIGTSGFTAGLGISKILQMGAQPEDGPIVVSGATGGVGVYAVQMLSKLGFEVWAVTGKKDAVSLLSDLGAAKVIGREDIMAPHEKPLLRPRWAGAFDTVGGETLVSLLKQCQKSGSVATCGNVGGLKLEMTVLPFILNGINLLGINA